MVDIHNDLRSLYDMDKLLHGSYKSSSFQFSRPVITLRRFEFLQRRNNLSIVWNQVPIETAHAKKMIEINKGCRIFLMENTFSMGFNSSKAEAVY